MTLDITKIQNFKKYKRIYQNSKRSINTLIMEKYTVDNLMIKITDKDMGDWF